MKTTTPTIQEQIKSLVHLHQACTEAGIAAGSGDWHLHLQKEKVTDLAAANEDTFIQTAHLDSSKTAWALLSAAMEYDQNSTPDEDAFCASLATEASSHIAVMMVDMLAGADYLTEQV
jgi:hypothetical protein